MFIESAAWYDHFYGGKDYAGEARRVTELIRRWRPGARSLLDVACGTGRHLEASAGLRLRRARPERRPARRGQAAPAGDAADQGRHGRLRPRPPPLIASGREGAMSVLRVHYAVAADGDVVSADERHELRLFTHHEYAAVFLAAGLDTSWDPPGLIGRGLLIGVAPG